MRPRLHHFVLPLALCLTACHHPAIPSGASVRALDAGGTGVRAVPGRVLVRWRDAAKGHAALATLGLTQGLPLAPSEETLELTGNVNVEALRRAAGDALEFVEPDYLFRLAPSQADTDPEPPALNEPEGHHADTKSDPMSGRQYALRLVGAQAAWKVNRGRPQLKIAIVDTGADLQHPDLVHQIVASQGMTGLRSRLGFGSAKDDNGHGTHCAGVAAAEAGNGVGIAGMAPGCKLLIAKVLDREGVGATSDIARGVNWAVDQGAGVISLSMGSEADAGPLRRAIQRALGAGVVVVAAMGNEGKQLRNFPAAYPGVIAVGATNAQDHSAGYSTRGPWISVSAPGTGILSTTPTYPVALSAADEANLTPSYGKLTGTSMATPLVAGLAGLVRSQHPDWTPLQVKSAIERAAVALDGGFNPRTGHGRVSAAAALGARDD